MKPDSDSFSFSPAAHSFVIRSWCEEREIPQAQAEWRGWVEHVQSGQRYYFQGEAAMHRIITRFMQSARQLPRLP